MAKQRITHKRILKIAIPIVIANATVPILGAVDTGVVGQLGEAAPIGAVGIGAIVIGAIFWIFGFLRMGTTGMVAQARGAGEQSEKSALLMRAMIVAAVAGVGIILIQLPLFWAVFIATPASAEVEGMARGYMSIRIWSAPAAITLYALSGWLIAHERTRALLLLQLWMNGLNIVLDLWFVLGLGWGVEGVAIATLIAEWSGFFLALYMCRGVFKGDKWRDWVLIFDRQKIKAMASVNGNIMLRSLLLQVILIGFLFVSASINDVTLAANQILIQFVNITAYGLDGFAIAAESLIGVSMGAKSRKNIRRTALMTAAWSGVGSLLMAAFFAIFGVWLIKVMTTSVDVQLAAMLYLPWMIASPIIGFASWVLDGIFIGATRSRDMRNAMFQSTIVFVVAVYLLLPVMGSHGIWLALLISYVARALTLMRYYPALEAAASDA